MSAFLDDLTKWIEGDPPLGELGAAIEILRTGYHSKALSVGDNDAFLTEGFEIGFKASGFPEDPIIMGNSLLLFGSKVVKSKMSHNCEFPIITEPGEESIWAWQSDLVIIDDMKPIPGTNGVKSVVIIPAIEGIEVSLILSSATGDRHKRKNVRSWKVEDGALVVVTGSKKKLFEVLPESGF